MLGLGLTDISDGGGVQCGQKACMPEEPVDFAIITALGVERETVVRRLEAVVRVQSDDEPLTFYGGSLGVPGEDQP